MIDELDFARRVAVEAGDNAARIRKGDIGVETKADDSPVTIADRDNERLICSRIERAFPDDGIVGEEGTRKAGTSGRRWTVDPIDGTRDFVRGNRFWCVLLALEQDGEAKVGVAHFPMLQETYWAARGHGSHRNGESIQVSNIDRLDLAVFSPNGMHRIAHESYGPRVTEFMSRFWAIRSVGGALDAAMLAAGQIEVWLERKAEIWDLAPLQVIIEEAGGRYFALDGSRRLDAGNAAACVPALEPQVREFFGIA